ncbi:ParB/RepB/Spo0J family partition protein [Lactobacillus sp. PV034]|uniref:ParB/RepB/Spo0J family partition protein n=1 Tax=Lactobacillus sp. PV034 TaxID=2594495 RepID=UPI002240CB3F|nr:ParB/RepB/Spo0J family partition protein [Lactobacillus sp. PV034]QNQ81257.1 ParB/RepB/Spo0J family partition protein [Lactobacillus sp. PV034]
MARKSNDDTKKKGLGKGLGKGLEALFDEGPKIEDAEEVSELSLEEIRPNPYQPRKTFEEKSLKELAESIKENGVFQPIIVRKSINGYEIIAGERRFRASKLAKKATIPAIIRDFDEAQMMEVAVLENLQREDLTPLEEAQAYETLQKNLGLTQEEVSKRLGKSRPYIANYLRLLTLPQKTKRLLQHGELSMGQARTLLGLKNKDEIDTLAKKVVKEGITVRQLESLVNRINEKSIAHPKQKRIKKSAFIKASEDELKGKFGTSVNITENKKGKGHLAIDFSSAEELNRILDLLGVDLDK